jgi:hypothetical protein
MIYLCAPRSIDRTIQFSCFDILYIIMAFDCRPTRLYIIVCFIVQPSVGLPSARSTKRDTIVRNTIYYYCYYYNGTRIRVLARTGTWTLTVIARSRRNILNHCYFFSFASWFQFHLLTRKYIIKFCVDLVSLCLMIIDNSSLVARGITIF